MCPFESAKSDSVCASTSRLREVSCNDHGSMRKDACWIMGAAPVAQRAAVGLDASLLHQLEQDPVLAVGQLLHFVLGQPNATRQQKRTSTVAAQLAVDVERVIARRIEGNERLAMRFRPGPQKIVE